MESWLWLLVVDVIGYPILSFNIVFEIQIQINGIHESVFYFYLIANTRQYNERILFSFVFVKLLPSFAC